MPTSIMVPKVFALLKSWQPKSILDIGVGFGKVGFLAREYLELWGHRRYDRTSWQVRIDGIEVHQDYIAEHHKIFYDNMFIGDVAKYLDIIPGYDVIIMCDVIEHLSITLGNRILSLANKYIVTTPAVFNAQGAAYGNEYETHISIWAQESFENSKVVVSDIEKHTPIIVGWKTGNIKR